MPSRYTPEYFCLKEYTAYSTYYVLSRIPLLSRRHREIFRELSENEYKHYLFWRKYTRQSECRVVSAGLRAILYVVYLFLFGLVFVTKLLEREEEKALEEYTETTGETDIPRYLIEEITRDEKQHEELFEKSISDVRAKYLGSIALGVSDSLVELTGIYAGSLGVFENTVTAGLVGVLAGVSASLSMAVASYVQAKSSGVDKPHTASLLTGIAYIVVSLLLSTPYFLLQSIIYAFTLMLLVAVGIAVYIGIYIAVIGEKSFKREVVETTSLLLGVSLLLYTLGSLLGERISIR